MSPARAQPSILHSFPQVALSGPLRPLFHVRMTSPTCAAFVPTPQNLPPAPPTQAFSTRPTTSRAPPPVSRAPRALLRVPAVAEWEGCWTTMTRTRSGLTMTWTEQGSLTSTRPPRASTVRLTSAIWRACTSRTAPRRSWQRSAWRSWWSLASATSSRSLWRPGRRVRSRTALPLLLLLALGAERAPPRSRPTEAQASTALAVLLAEARLQRPASALTLPPLMAPLVLKLRPWRTLP